MKHKIKNILTCFIIFTGLETSVFATSDATQQALHYIAKNHFQAAKSLLNQQAQKKDAEAIFYLSQIELFVEKKDPQKGLDLLFHSMRLGFVPARDVLAGFYLQGEFMPKDAHQAAMHYKIAANQGYGPSQFNYGIMRKNGENIPQDLEEAFIYLALAALNTKDLDEVTEDAAFYRNEVARKLTPAAYTHALERLNKLIK